MIGVRVSDEILKEVDEAAEKFGTTRAGLAMMGLEIITRFEPEFYQKIQDQAKKLNIDVGLYIQNKMIRDLAQREAKKAISPDEKRILNEFLFTESGPVTGNQLFKLLFEQYLKEEIARKLDQIKKKEGYQIPLNKEEKEFLQQYGK